MSPIRCWTVCCCASASATTLPASSACSLAASRTSLAASRPVSCGGTQPSGRSLRQTGHSSPGQRPWAAAAAALVRRASLSSCPARCSRSRAPCSSRCAVPSRAVTSAISCSLPANPSSVERIRSRRSLHFSYQRSASPRSSRFDLTASEMGGSNAWCRDTRSPADSTPCFAWACCFAASASPAIAPRSASAASTVFAACAGSASSAARARATSRSSGPSSVGMPFRSRLRPASRSSSSVALASIRRCARSTGSSRPPSSSIVDGVRFSSACRAASIVASDWPRASRIRMDRSRRSARATARRLAASALEVSSARCAAGSSGWRRTSSWSRIPSVLTSPSRCRATSPAASRSWVRHTCRRISVRADGASSTRSRAKRPWGRITVRRKASLSSPISACTRSLTGLTCSTFSIVSPPGP